MGKVIILTSLYLFLDRGGPQILDFIIQTVLTNLGKWDGEIPIAIETSQILLTLSQIKQVPSHLLSLPSWQELLKAHAASHPLLTRLTPGYSHIFPI
jgi:hypothetical protein